MAHKKIGEYDEIVRFIERFKATNGYPPTVREVAAEWDVSADSAHKQLRKMIDAGLIQVTPGLSRSMNVTGAGMKMLTEEL